MYVRREKSWLKHLDFGILDIISIIVAFYIGYVCRHGADSGAGHLSAGKIRRPHRGCDRYHGDRLRGFDQESEKIDYFVRMS